jgi:hypothetical protein
MYSLRIGSISETPAINGGRFSYSTAPLKIERNYPVPSPYKDYLVKRFAYNESDNAVANLAIALSIPAATGNAISYLAEATQRDFESTLTPTRYYGIGLLIGSVIEGATELTVEFPVGSADLDAAKIGDKLLIQDVVTSGAHVSTNNEIVEIDNLVWAGDTATITLTAGTVFSWSDQATVSACIVATDVVAKISNVVATNCSVNQGLISLTWDATIEQTITLNFPTNSTDFTVTSDVLGSSLPDGNIASLYAPINPATGTPYISIPSAVWNSVTAGATLVLQAHPSAAPFWTMNRAFPSADATYVKLDNIAIKSF